MPRPRKCRRVCHLPETETFGPLGGGTRPDDVVMTVEEYETIRLIDREGLTQEQCAKNMGVARTTAQAIYGSARRKLAECLVEGRRLIIRGGSYIVCGGTPCGCSRCHKRRHCGQAEEATDKLSSFEKGEQEHENRGNL